MALTTRAGKGSKLNSVEMDTNILELSRILSSSDGTGIIQVTGSTIQAPNTSITASYFRGDGSALTNVTASYSPAAGSNTYIQYNNNGILGAEAAFTYNATSNTLTVTNIAASDIQVTKAINAGNGYLLDGGDITSIDWKNRTLNWPNGSSAFDWNTQGAIKFTSAADAAGAADKILVLRSSNGQVFITGSTAFNPSTASLLITASATNNIITFTKGNGSTFNVTVNTGSGGVPSSPVNSIQFNNAGVFGGDGSFAFDINAFSLAQGSNTTASGLYSHAEGYNNIASGNGSHAEGRFTTASNSFSHAEGRLTLASGQYAHAEGWLSTALQNYSHAEGVSSIASGLYSHAEGSNTYTLGQASHAEGYFTSASGNWSHAEGNTTIASGQYSHAEGDISLATGDYSHAEGRDTNSTGDYSHTEGTGTTTSGIASHAEGNSTQAIGDYSHAQGLNSISFGDHSFAGGNATIASGSYQTAIGQYNTHNDSTSYFIVGSGISDGSRKDAFKVTSNSSIIVATQSATPGWTGKEGEMVPVKNGASYFIYVYIGGAWRSSSLT